MSSTPEDYTQKAADTLAQIGWIVAGLVVVLIARQFLH